MRLPPTIATASRRLALLAALAGATSLSAAEDADRVAASAAPARGGIAAGSGAPRATRSRHVLVAAAGDIACDPADRFFNGTNGTSADCGMRRTADLVLAARPRAVFPLGDLQYEDAALAKFEASYAPTWGRFKRITHPVPGGHEYGTPHAAGYFDYFNGPGRRNGKAGRRGRGYYSFDIARWHVIALNDNCEFKAVGCRLSSRQVRWLRRDLRRHRRRCTLALAHHPQFSSTIRGNYRPLRNMFKLLYRARAELVLSGDSHNYERFAPQTPGGRLSPRRGVRQFVVGTGGKNLANFQPPIWPNSEAQNSSTFGVLFLRLHRVSYTWQFVAPGGGIVDSGRDRCH